MLHVDDLLLFYLMCTRKFCRLGDGKLLRQKQHDKKKKKNGNSDVQEGFEVKTFANLLIE